MARMDAEAEGDEDASALFRGNFKRMGKKQKSKKHQRGKQPGPSDTALNLSATKSGMTQDEYKEGLLNIFSNVEEKKTGVIVKTDNKGMLETVTNAIELLIADKGVDVEIVSSGVGDIKT
jgi:translation initiation factor IF-2